MRTKLSTRRALSLLLAVVMMVTTVMQATQISANAMGIFGNDSRVVKLISSDNGSLSFIDKDGSSAYFEEGDTVQVQVSPTDGYGAKLAVYTESEYLDFDYDDASQVVSFTKPDKAVAVSAQFEWGRTTRLNEVKSGGTEDAFDYMLKSLNEAYVNIDNVSKVTVGDAILVKHTLADGSKMGSERTIDALWADLMSADSMDEYSMEDMAFLSQSQAIMMLYDVDPESEYYVAYANTMSKDSESKVTDWAFAYTNLNGETIDDCIYDEETGLVYVPKYYTEENKNEAGMLNVQVQLLHVFDTEEITSNVNVVVNAENVKGEVAESGMIKTDAQFDEIYIQLAENDKAKEDINEEDITVLVNGDESSFAYSNESGIIGIPANAAAADTIEIDVKQEPETVGDKVMSKAFDIAEDLGLVAKAAKIRDTSGIGWAGQVIKVSATPTAGDVFYPKNCVSNLYFGKGSPTGVVVSFNDGTPTFDDADCQAAYNSYKSKFATGQDVDISISPLGDGSKDIHITNGHGVTYIQNTSNSMVVPLAKETFSVTGETEITNVLNGLSFLEVFFKGAKGTGKSGITYTYDGWYNNSGKFNALLQDHYGGDFEHYTEGLSNIPFETSYVLPFSCAHINAPDMSIHDITAKVLYVNETEHTMYIGYVTGTQNSQTGVAIVKYMYELPKEYEYGVSVQKVSSGPKYSFYGITFDMYVDGSKKGTLHVGTDGNLVNATGFSSDYTLVTKDGTIYITWKSRSESHVVKLIESLGTNKYYGIGTTKEQTKTLTEGSLEYYKFVYTNPPHPVYVSVEKQSSDPEMTANSTCYDLAGAEFALYTSAIDAGQRKNPIGTLKTVKQGDGTYRTGQFNLTTFVANGTKTFYVRETKAPEGFELDNSLKTVIVTDDDIQNERVLKVTFSDKPMSDPVFIEITKENSEGAEAPVSLEGAVFEIAYYNEIVNNKSSLPATATRKWYVKTVKNEDGKYVANLNVPGSFLESVTIDGTTYTSDERYIVNNRADVPFGSVTMKEIKAADGYVLESGTVKAGNGMEFSDRVAFFMITRNEQGAVVVRTTNGLTTKSLNVTNKPARGELSFEKKDLNGDPIENVEFKLALVDDNGNKIEEYTIKTDADGKYNSKNDDNLWFYGAKDHTGMEKTAGEGKLVTGNYVLTEVKNGKTYDYQLIDPLKFAVKSDKSTRNLGTITNVAQPTIKTLEWDNDTSSHMSFADDSIAVRDTVTWKFLRANKDYTVKGILMEIGKDGNAVPLLDDDGNIIVAHKSFNSGAAKTTKSVYDTEGTVDVDFSFAGKTLEGKTFVIYEYLYDGNSDEDLTVTDNEVVKGNVKKNDNGTEISHADKDDLSQTGYIPKVRTSASNMASQSHVAYAELLTIYDEVKYQNLVAGEDYVVTGTVVDAATGKAITKDGKAVTATEEITNAKANGSVTLTFSLDAKDCEGKSFVVFEELKLKSKGTKVAEHKDLKDKSQTIVVPKIGTTALDSKTRYHIALAEDTMTFTDTIAYENLWTGIEYEAKGWLVYADGTPVTDKEGNAIKTSYKFTPAKADGSVELTFNLNNMDINAIEGKSMVAFEELYFNGSLVADHKDVTDEGQTITIPKVRTSASNDETKTKLAKADAKLKITDTVSIKGLIVGDTYVIRGRLFDKTAGDFIKDENGENVVAEYSFVADKTDMKLSKLKFSFDGSKLEGHTFVVFETLYWVDDDGNEKEVGKHEDKDDKDQTITIPSIRTTATSDDTEDHVTMPKADAKLTDVVAYENLTAGKKYTVVGKIMIRNIDDEGNVTGEELLDKDGNPVTAYAEFEAKENSLGNPATVDVKFSFDGTGLEGRDIVVYEYLYEGEYREDFKEDDKVAVHEDITDEDQTIHFPEVGTTLLDTKTNDHNAYAEEEIVLIDTVEYKNLIADKEYTITGILMDKNTGEFMGDDEGNLIKSSVKFTPKAGEENGFVEVPFTFKGVSLKGKTIVAFESLTYKEIEVAVHAELEDDDQTVRLPEITTELRDAESGIKNTAIDNDVTLIDTVTAKNLLKDHNYKIVGTLYNRLTGEALKINGEPIEIEEYFDTFEKAEEAEASGEDAEAPAEEGTEEPVTTETEDSDTEEPVTDTEGSDEAPADGEAGEAEETEESKYVDLTIDVTYKFDGTKVEGLLMEDGHYAPIVCFEKLYVLYDDTEVATDDDEDVTDVTEPADDTADEEPVDAGPAGGEDAEGTVPEADEVATSGDATPKVEKVIAVHADLNDDHQTVDIPWGYTTAKDADTDSHTAFPDEEVTIVDTVNYFNLIPGKEYEMTGTLYIKKDGEAAALTKDGEIIKETVKFTPETADGTVDVVFKIDASLLTGEKVVVFEDCSYNGVKLFSHADIEDDDQTIRFPEVKTVASFVTGEKSLSAANGTELTIVDELIYKNLTVGEKYTAEAALMNPATKEEFLVNGKPVTGKTEFTPETENGVVKVELTFTVGSDVLKPGSSMELVIFETVFAANGKIVGEHKDFTDTDQTVTLNIPRIQTGDNNMLPIAGAIGAAALLGAGVMTFIKKKDEDENEA